MPIQLADGRYVMSDAEQTAYLTENPDVTVAISQGLFADAADHFNRYGKNEDRGGKPNINNLDDSVTIAGVRYANNANVGGIPSDQQRFNTANQQAIQTFNMTAPPRTDPVDLSPVTDAVQGVADQIGPALPGQTNLFAGQAGIMSGQQNLANIVRPLGEQVTRLETSIGTAAEGQAPTLMGQTADIQAGIGTAGEGQTDLFAGQAGIQAGIGQAGEGQTDLFAGQAGLAGGQATLSENQAALQAGQTGLGTQIGALGTAAVTDPDTGEVTQKPTGLFAGQAGLMAGQTGLTQDISGLGRELSDVSADIGGQLTGLGGQLGAFRSGVEQYQRGATTQRGDIQGTQRAGQANLLAQIQGVGQQANRAAEMMAQQRQMQTQRQQPAVQQQAAQFAASAPRATPSNQQVGPMGPMASDPRDALIQNLLRRTSLMNRRPV